VDIVESHDYDLTGTPAELNVPTASPVRFLALLQNESACEKV
jgi:hypothetical protein